jgi:hypothetical protein
MVLQISFGDLAAVDPSTIPNQDDFARGVPAKMVQRFDKFLAIDRTFKMPFVDFAGKRQGHCRRQRSPFLGHSTKDRSFSCACPSSSQRFLKGETKFIPNYDFCVEPPRLFLSWTNLAATRLLPTLYPAPLLAARVFVD